MMAHIKSELFDEVIRENNMVVDSLRSAHKRSCNALSGLIKSVQEMEKFVDKGEEFYSCQLESELSLMEASVKEIDDIESKMTSYITDMSKKNFDKNETEGLSRGLSTLSKVFKLINAHQFEDQIETEDHKMEENLSDVEQHLFTVITRVLTRKLDEAQKFEKLLEENKARNRAMAELMTRLGKVSVHSSTLPDDE
ncbi:hypothetical protein QAD02_010764 [Eretmocerus hayati]|uniref:Uncharacterized protein n=1 Tax=Eretmocerus hayati TaxID=131215 RepID=A0ACC2NUV5_9HYME|nr:hypothetical protein QAD02_010764 [Eretmocerus hayati]